MDRVVQRVRRGGELDGAPGCAGVAEPAGRTADERPEFGAFTCEPSLSTMLLGARDSITAFSRGPALSGRSVSDPALV